MAMKVYIANFGVGNYAWPACKARSTIATMNQIKGHAFWEANDREGYIQWCMTTKTPAGIAPSRPVASRWFNLMTVIAQSSGDIWIHREKKQLWWTTSRVDPPAFEKETALESGSPDLIVCYKPCDPWSDKNRQGNRLDWDGLHPRAREFLFTEGTLQQLGEDNADYALALIDGADLAPWHSRSAWKDKAERARGKRGLATSFNPKQRAAVRMVMTANGTVAGANGQQVLRTVKNKESKFTSNQEFEEYLINLLEMQENLCAITNLPLQFDGEHEDIEMLCSLDRVDSEGHYEAGNLQVVCRFVNRWKGSEKDQNFRRLISIIRSVSSI